MISFLKWVIFIIFVGFCYGTVTYGQTLDTIGESNMFLDNPILLGIPLGLWVIALAVGVAFVWYVRVRGEEAGLEILDLFRGSILDAWVTEMFGTLPQPVRDAVKDIIEILSPLTSRTPGQLDDRTLEILIEVSGGKLKRADEEVLLVEVSEIGLGEDKVVLNPITGAKD